MVLLMLRDMDRVTKLGPSIYYLGEVDVSSQLDIDLTNTLLQLKEGGGDINKENDLEGFVMMLLCCRG